MRDGCAKRFREKPEADAQANEANPAQYNNCFAGETVP